MEIRLQMGKGGRLVIPVRLCRALNLKAGDVLVARLENDSIRLMPLRQAIQLAQKAVRQYAPQGVSLVDELIKARREEAGNE